jgi:hypothetical protein
MIYNAQNNQIEDAPDQEIQKFFNEASEFIHNAIQEDKAVLGNFQKPASTDLLQSIVAKESPARSPRL